MAEKRLQFRPGINLELSQSANRGGWSSSNLIRWRYGMPEVNGGWQPLSSTPVVGVCRGLHFWRDLSSVARFAAGTTQRLYLYDPTTGAQSDITPLAYTVGKISSGATPYSLGIWSLDNFGQNLIANPSGQTIFQWVPGSVGPAAPLLNAPAKNQGIFVAMQQQILMAFGCTPLAGGNPDPMLIRWTTQSDDTVWVADPTNQAGSFRLTRGNRIIGGMQVPNFGLIWTDLDVWMIQYIQFPLVFSFTQIGSNCGLIGQKAAVVLGGIVYWMSDHGFFRMGGGGPEQIPCPVWDAVFKDLDTVNQDKCFAAANYHYSEVIFYYPSLSGGTGEVDSFVKMNVQEGEWDTGLNGGAGVPNAMARTAWTDQNQPGSPISVDLMGTLQQADQGFNAGVGQGVVPASITSGFMDIADGDQIMTIDKFIPDFLWKGSTTALNLTMLFREFSGDTITTLGPFAINPSTEFVTLRLPRQIRVGGQNIVSFAAPRGREVAIKLDAVSGWWRMGAPRVNTFTSGKL